MLLQRRSAASAPQLEPAPVVMHASNGIQDVIVDTETSAELLARAEQLVAIEFHDIGDAPRLLELFRAQARKEGWMSPDGIKALLRKERLAVPDVTLDLLIATVDTDASGTLDIREFLMIIRRMRAGFNDSKGLAKTYSHLLEQQRRYRPLFFPVTPRLSIAYALRSLQERVVFEYETFSNKSSTIISVSALVLSFAVGTLVAGKGSYTLVVFSAFMFMSLVFAVLAVMPHSALRAKKVKNEKEEEHTNLLFFEHNSRFPQDTFIDAFGSMLLDDRRLYAEILRDVYLSGTVLGTKKAPYLRISYFLFGIGTALSLLTFIITASVHTKPFTAFGPPADGADDHEEAVILH